MNHYKTACAHKADMPGRQATYKITNNFKKEVIMKPAKKAQEWLPSVFNDFFDYNWPLMPKATVPAINVTEDDTDYRVELAAPGTTKDDFKVHVDANDNLVIVMEKKDEKKDDGKSKYLRREFNYSKFEQALSLPADIDKDKIAAKVENGVLTVTIPKDKSKCENKPQKNIEIG